MTNLIDPPATEPVTRDRWGRPKIVPPDAPSTGTPVPYTRCTTYVSALEDTYNLTRWKMRQVALGLADRADLLLAVSAHRGTKHELNRLADAAMEAAQSSAAATTGTALHTLTERHDRDEHIGAIPASAREDLDAYIAVTRNLDYAAIEQFRVHDHLRVAGTADRIVDLGDRYVIGDIKTGSIEFGLGKICMQLAMYAHSVPYTHPSGDRVDDAKPVDLQQGLIIHLPAERGECHLYWVDLEAGWDAVQLATAVRAWRTHKNLTTPATSLSSRTPHETVAAFTDLETLRAWWVEQHQHGRTSAELLDACQHRARQLQDHP